MPIQTGPIQVPVVESHGTIVVDIPSPTMLDEHWEIFYDGKWHEFPPYMEIPVGKYKWRRVRTYAEEVWVDGTQ